MRHQINRIRFPLHWLDAHGIARHRAVDGTGLTLDAAGEVADIPSTSQERQLFRQLQQLLDDPLLGLRIGASYRLEMFGHYGYTLQHAATLGEAIKLSQHYQALRCPLFFSSLLLEGPLARAVLRPMVDFGDVSRLLHEREAAMLCRCFTQLYQRPFPLRRIRLPHSAAQFIPAYEAHFGCPVETGAELLVIEFDSDAMAHALPLADQRLCDSFAAECDRQLREVGQHQSVLSQHIRSQLLATAGRMPTASEIAAAQGISARTLRRQLSDAGLTFRQLLNTTRYALAQELLLNSDAPIEQLAYRLGYGDPGSFSHAFRRWSGVSPQAFRHKRDLDQPRLQ